TEREIHYGRLEAAKAFAATHKLTRITVPTPNAWLGIAAPGKTYYDLREALAELGLDDAALGHHGIRLLKIGMLFPMEPTIVREFAAGLEELLVIEEKRAFCELFIRDVLYNQAVRPLVFGKRDERERPLVPADSELDADRIAQIVASRLERRLHLESITARVALLEALRQRPASLTLARQPYFCSGCPHNRSTVLPEGSMASAGIGRHRVGFGRRGVAPRPARRGAAPAARHSGRHRARLRPAVRRGKTPAAQAGPAARPINAGVHQRSRLRRVRRLRREEQLPLRAP